MSIPIFAAANRLEAMWAEFLAWLDAFFNPELEGYVNFDFGGATMVNLRVIVFGIFAGVLVASVYMVYVKSVIGPFVRKLLAEECLSEESAKTLEELGYTKNFFVRMALRGSVLRSTVIHVPCEETGEEGEKRTFVLCFYFSVFPSTEKMLMVLSTSRRIWGRKPKIRKMQIVPMINTNKRVGTPLPRLRNRISAT